MKDIINSNEKIVVGIVSPAVRVSIGECFNMEAGVNTEGKLVTALKKSGFDYVFDTAFGADLTILEEVAEFAARLTNKGPLPQFTSCCPAWVKYAEIYHPELESILWRNSVKIMNLRVENYGAVTKQQWVIGEDDVENAWRYGHSWLLAGDYQTFVLPPLKEYDEIKEINIMKLSDAYTSKGVVRNV